MQTLHYNTEKEKFKEVEGDGKGNELMTSELTELAKSYILQRRGYEREPELQELQHERFVKLIADEIFKGDTSKVKVEHVYASELGEAAPLSLLTTCPRALTHSHLRERHISQLWRSHPTLRVPAERPHWPRSRLHKQAKPRQASEGTGRVHSERSAES